jgi:hypothetical protein
MNMRSLGWFAATLLLTCLAQGQPPRQAEARQRFQEGVGLAQAGDLEAAIRAFEAAYAAQPNHSVLYNIGQAQAALGRPALALASFERCLAEGGSQIAEGRRSEIQALIDSSRKRLGTLRVTATEPERTRVWLDGVELRAAQVQEPLVVAVGTHTLLHAVGAGAPTSTEVVIASGRLTEARLSAPPEPASSPGQLVIQCAVPAMSVVVDGKVLATTPVLQPLLVASGRHALRFSRPGYRQLERHVVVEPAASSSVLCDEQLETPLARNLAAGIQIQVTPANAVVLVDGQRGPHAALPFGAHDLLVEHPSYKPYRRSVTLEAGKSTTYSVTLEPTAATRARAERARSQRTTLGYVLGGAGVGSLVASGGLFLWNQRRFDDWQAGSGAASDLDRAASVQRVDDLSIGLGLLGAGLAASATWLLFSNPDQDPAR